MADGGPEGAVESGAREAASAGPSASDVAWAGDQGSFVTPGAPVADTGRGATGNSPTHIRLEVFENARDSPDVNHDADRDGGGPPRASNGTGSGAPTGTKAAGTSTAMGAYLCGCFAPKDDPDGLNSRAINTLPTGVPVPKPVGISPLLKSISIIRRWPVMNQNSLFSTRTRAAFQIHLQFLNVGYSVHVSKKAGGHKHILKGISGEVLPGELLAIMGTTVRRFFWGLGRSGPTGQGQFKVNY